MELLHACAYCQKDKPLDQLAGEPQFWPGQGKKAVCKECAGIVWCPPGRHDWDAGETGCWTDRACFDHDES